MLRPTTFQEHLLAVRERRRLRLQPPLTSSTAALEPECVYRGAQIGAAKCRTCKKKNTTLRVFQCSVHKRCCLSKKNQGTLHSCPGCGERRTSSQLNVPKKVTISLAVLKPAAYDSEVWRAGMKICRKCKHYRDGAAEMCAANDKQCSTNRIKGTCPLPAMQQQQQIQPEPKPEPFAVNNKAYTAREHSTVDFPIDMVYLWVDGSDPEWQATFTKYYPKASVKNSRYTSADELKYALRSVERFAPWINRVWLVTNGQVPKWLTKYHPKLTLVTHEQIIDKKYLPTFNSQAIECNIHKIDGMAECFLYGNDDMLFGAPVYPSDFFTANGKAIMRFSGGSVRSENGGIFNDMKNNAAEILDSEFGEQKWKRGWHYIKAYNRSMMADAEERAPQAYHRSRSNKTRRSSDVAWNCAFWPSFSIEAGYATRAANRITAMYINAGMDEIRERMSKVLRRTPELICVNNTTPGRVGVVREFLTALLPSVSSFERQPQHYSISRKMGDAVYMLAVLKQKGDNCHLHYRPKFVDARLDHYSAFAFLKTMKPLLLAQPFIKSVDFAEELIGTDLDSWQSYAWSPETPRLVDKYAQAVGIKSAECTDPWLIVPGKDRRASVIIARSTRYHNPNFPWRKVLSKYEDIGFVGLPHEHARFVKSFGKVRYIPTPNCMTLAKVIAGSDLFIGNQSFPFALAIAMGKAVVQEVFEPKPDCIINRRNAIYGRDANVALPKIGSK